MRCWSLRSVLEPGGRTNTYRLLARLVGRVPQPGQTTSNAMSVRQGSGRPQALAGSRAPILVRKSVSKPQPPAR